MVLPELTHRIKASNGLKKGVSRNSEREFQVQEQRKEAVMGPEGSQRLQCTQKAAGQQNTGRLDFIQKQASGLETRK